MILFLHVWMISRWMDEHRSWELDWVNVAHGETQPLSLLMNIAGWPLAYYLYLKPQFLQL